ncbi:hypothetical protein EJB05_02206, partial [Eragrostis curvula]
MQRSFVQDHGTVDRLAQLGPALYECAVHVTEGSFEKTDNSLRQIKGLASIVDGSLQRLSSTIAYSLARRLLCPIQGFDGALIHPSDYFEQSSIQIARENFANLSPYISSGFATINQAILEALEEEKVTQYFEYAHKMSLSREAEALKVPFQFTCVNGRLETLDFNNLRNTLQIKFGEAIAISCALEMHRLLVVDDNVTCAGIAQLQKMLNIAQLKQMASSAYSPASTLNYPQTPSPQTPKLLASFLNAVGALKPNIMLVMEQDANHNALLFCDRFMEVLNYYAALFDSLHAVAGSNRWRADERARVERMILGEEIKNILLCEGVRRHERHERLSQWAMYMKGSGFNHVPLSFSAIWKLRSVVSMLQDELVSSATSSPASSTTLYNSPSSAALAHGGGYGSWVQELSHDQQSVRLVGLLYQCAAEVSAGAFDRANFYLEQITQLASLDAPHTLQRLAAVFADALARKLLNLVPGLSRALLLTSSSSGSAAGGGGGGAGEAHHHAARRHLFDALPFMKLAYLTTNHAILEAMEGERFVHVVDLSGACANPVQWIALFHAFRGRRGGPPHLRVTAVHESREFLAGMGGVLAREAEAFDIPFQFNGVEARLEEVDPDALRHSLRVRSGEALAISVVAQLHRLLAADDHRSGRHGGGGGGGGSSCLTPLQIIAARSASPRSFGELLERELNTRLQLSPSSDSSAALSSSVLLSSSSPLSPASGTPPPQQRAKLGSFLAAVKALSPAIMVMTEPEANHNAAAFQERFDEALNYYASLFDCLERSTGSSGGHQHQPRANEERARVERLVLGEEIRGVVAREGAERKERHERLAQWARRMEAAGMERVGLSYGGMKEARKLLQSCGWGGYEVVHDARGEGFFFCWHRKPLYSISAWRPAARVQAQLLKRCDLCRRS